MKRNFYAVAVAAAVTLGACATGTGPTQIVSPPKASTECSTGTSVTLDAKAKVSVCGTINPTTPTVIAYKGIRYATAKRWEDPQTEKWKRNTTIVATVFGPKCPQSTKPSDYSSNQQSEDCLYINVYAPQDAINNPAKKLPVMLFIHGGAFVTGSGDDYDGATLAQKGSVVVTFNYRLGALGFLQPLLPFTRDNFGFLDQQMAMKWVHDHIAPFGGNPGNVTLFGESAGAMSVGLHTLDAPGSAGLFAKAIMESNPAGAIYQTSVQAKVNTGIFYYFLCRKYSRSPIVCEALARQKASPLYEIVRAQNFKFNLPPGPQETAAQAGGAPAARAPFSDIGPEPAPLTAAQPNEDDQADALAKSMLDPLRFQSLPWSPHVDGKIIVGQPLNGFAKNMPRIPVAFGVNRDEGVLFAVLFNDKVPITAKIYDGVLNLLFKDQKDQILALDRYNPASTPSIQGLDPAVTALANLMTDYAFTCGNIAIADKLLDDKKSKPVYGYFFTQKPFFDLFAKVDHQTCSPEAANVCHAFELPYVFNLLDDLKYINPSYVPTQADTALAGQMTAAWYDFAVNPTT